MPRKVGAVIIFMAMNYRMEIVEDKDEGGFVLFFPSCQGALLAEKQWNQLSQMHWMPRRHG